MSNMLYLDAQTGISGDMTVAALLDLGADKEVLEKGLLSALNSLSVQGFQANISRVKKAGLDCCDFDVVLDHEHENHDHDMEYLYGHNHHEHEHHHDHDHHDHEHEYDHHHDHHDHEHEHHHDHDHKHNHDHHHEHRGFYDIKKIIDESGLTDRAKSVATRIFEIIAEAEAKAHGESFEKVHFHEVGAVDSIVDVVSVAYLIDALDITEVIVPYLSEGQGSVRCQHGILPVPVPAVTNIVTAHGISLKVQNVQGELVTPTGAAIVAAIKTRSSLPETFEIIGSGLGAGKRAYERPSILRAMLIRDVKADASDYIYKLETDIDDCSGEALGYTMDKLLKAGALDAHYVPVFMKKNRPAYELTVICKEADVSTVESIIFSETTSIGIRRSKMERSILPRSIETVKTSLGEILVKKCTLPDGSERCYPEYEAIKKIAENEKFSYQKIVNIINKEMLEKEDF